ncbi:hypothetical protein KL914_002861 [Ogataea haglerorum]|nr:hypothetical protein KL914_002861 [Ogataea haglerorum]
MRFQLIVTNHPTAEIARPSVFVTDSVTGKRHFIGQVPEGLQRQCNEMGFRTSRLDTMFLTGIMDWTAISGLPGLILTVADQGLKDLQVVHTGNNILQYVVASWRYFVFRFGLKLKIDDLDVYKSDAYKVKAVNIKSASQKHMKLSKAFDRVSDLVQYIFLIKTGMGNTGRALMNIEIPSDVHNPKVSANYIMTGNPIRGRFLVEKAKELGCPRQKYKNLCNFQSVTLDDGTEIKPEQVLEPQRTFDSILFLDIPGPEYLQNTIKHDWKSELSGKKYSAVYHFVDESVNDVLDLPEYQQFIRSFGPDTYHFISHRQYVPDTLNFLASYVVSLKWHALLPDLFPLFRWSDQPEKQIPEGLSNVRPMLCGQTLGFGPGVTSIMRANSCTSTDEVVKTVRNAYAEEIAPLQLPNFVSEEEFVKLATAPPNNKLKHAPDRRRPLKEQVEVLVLGTGSALPSKLRNVISNAVRVPTESGYRTIFLDAGENTLGSINKLYSQEDVATLFRELKMVYLSHLHADHHIGIVALLQKWCQVRSEHDKLYVVAPWQYEKFLVELQRIDSTLDLANIVYLSCDQFNSGKVRPEFEQIPIEDVPENETLKARGTQIEPRKNIQLQSQLYKDAGLNAIKTCYAFHCEYSYSCVLDFAVGSESFKVAYSGDTRPRQAFAKLGYDCDLLVHEATLEDDKYEDAIEKRHSTTLEAVQMGILMKTKKLLLTHFSQRYRYCSSAAKVYEKLQNPLRSNSEVDPRSPILKVPLIADMVDNAPRIEAIIAFDNMHIPMDKFGLQKKVFQALGDKLERLFNSDAEENMQEENPQNNKKRRAT